MTDTLLADLIRRQTFGSVLTTFNRAIDRVAEDLAQEILREPEFRENMRQLVRVAFADALRQLGEPSPPPTRSADRTSTEQMIRDARDLLDRK